MNLLSRIKISGALHVIGIIVVAFLVRTFGYGLYHVPTASMENTMLAGELFFSNKASLIFGRPTHGDIIAFNDPTYAYAQSRLMRIVEQYVWGPENWTKRVIGLPGDTIVGCTEQGKPVIYRNGVRLTETYVNQKNSKIQSQLWDRSDEFNITLKDDQYWVMGDNRSNSFDSRLFGPLDARLIHGKIVYRLFSINKTGAWALLDMMAHPIDYCKFVRLNRCMERVV